MSTQTSTAKSVSRLLVVSLALGLHTLSAISAAACVTQANRLVIQPFDVPQRDRPANPVAHEHYMKAMRLNAVTAAEWKRTSELLEKAAALDPTYAPALAALGNAYMQYAGKVGGGEQYYKQSEAVLRRALTINDELPQTLYALGTLYAKIGKSEESATLLQRAVKLYPEAPGFHAALGYVYRYAGLLDESIKEYRKAQVLSQDTSGWVDNEEQITKALIYKGDYRAALLSHREIAARLERAKQPNDHKELFYAGVIHFYAQDQDEATRFFDAAAAIDAASIWSLFGAAYKEAGRGDRRRLFELAKELETRDIVDGERRYRLAHFYALAGHRKDALRSLRGAIEAGFFNSPYISQDPLLASIKETGEFQILLDQASKRHEMFKQRFAAR